MSKYLIKLSLFLIVMGLLGGCTLHKRQHLPGYHVSWNNPAKSKQLSSGSQIETQTSPTVSAKESNTFSQEAPEFTASSSADLRPSNQGKFSEFVESIMNSFYFNPDSCDRIIDQDGDEIMAKVTEIALDVIKYKRCDYLNGPTYSIPRASVVMIEYANGTREVIKTKKPEAKPEPDYSNVDDVYYANGSKSKSRRVEGLGLAGFIITLVNLPLWWLISQIFGIVAGVLGIIFGSIGIHRCRKNPDTKWGMGFAVTSLVVGLVMVLVSLIFLLILL